MVVDKSQARIEISYEEYKMYQDKFVEFENKIVTLEKQINTLNEQIVLKDETIEDLVNSGLIERVFKWDKLLTELNVHDYKN